MAETCVRLALGPHSPQSEAAAVLGTIIGPESVVVVLEAEAVGRGHTEALQQQESGQALASGDTGPSTVLRG